MKKLKTFLTIIPLLFLFVNVGLGQISGDYRSKATGFWDAVDTWETFDGTNWITPVTKPTGTNSVYLQAGFTVTLQINEACNNLNVCKGTTSSATSGFAVLSLGAFTLDVNGNLRNYYGTVGTIPGTANNTVNDGCLLSTAGSGKMKFVGNTRTILTTGEWGNNPTGWDVEFSPASGNTLSIQTGFKARNITISSGIITTSNADIRPDGGSAGVGTLTIKNGSKLQFTGSAAIKRVGTASATSHFGTLTVENGAILEFSGTTNPTIGASTFDFSGSITYSGAGAQTLATKGSNSGGADPNTYTNLILNGSGIKTLGVNTTINGTLTISGTTTSLALGAFTLTYGSSAILEYAGSNAQTTTNTEFPISGLNNLKINNSNGVNLHANRSLSGSLTLTNGIFVSTSSNKLTLNTASIVSSGSTSSFIQGPVDLMTNATGLKNVPVGYGTEYRSIGINPTSTLVTTYTIEFINSGYNTTQLTDPLKVVSQNDYLEITRTGSADAYFSIGWISDVGIYSLSDLRLAHYDIGTSKWVAITGSLTGGSTLSSGTITSDAVITSFSPFALGSVNPAATLPVKLATFNSSINVRNIKLNWVTESENNNSGFEIERAVVSSGNLEFRKLGFVNGNGTKNSPTNYSFEDRNLQTGKYKYRLKQIDVNGNFEYFNLNGEIEIGVPAKYDLSQNYPNPFNPVTKINFDLPKDTKVELRVYDMLGREVSTLVNEVRKAGYYTVDFNASQFSSGVYFYRLVSGDFSMVKKLVILK